MKTIRSLIALLLCATTLTAGATEKEQRALAEQVLIAMDMPGTIESSYAVMQESMAASIEHLKKATADAEGSEQAADSIAQMMTAMAAELSWDKVKDDYITLYAETFDADELKGLLAFYQSEAGQAFVKKQPELMRRSMELGQKQVQRIMPTFQSFSAEVQSLPSSRHRNSP